MYNVTIVEEVVNYDGTEVGCKCACNHEGSSDSGSSLDSFVADSLVSAKLSNEEDENEGGNGWRPEKVTGGGVGWLAKQARKVLEKECSERHDICQGKKGISYTKKDLIEQGVSTEMTALSDTQKRVSEACEAIQYSVGNLVDSSHTCNSAIREAHSMDGTGLSSMAESAKGAFIRAVGVEGDARLEVSQSEVTKNMNVDEPKDEEGEAGNEKLGITSGDEGGSMEGASITPERVRHLRAL